MSLLLFIFYPSERACFIQWAYTTHSIKLINPDSCVDNLFSNHSSVSPLSICLSCTCVCLRVNLRSPWVICVWVCDSLFSAYFPHLCCYPPVSITLPFSVVSVYSAYHRLQTLSPVFCLFCLLVSVLLLFFFITLYLLFFFITFATALLRRKRLNRKKKSTPPLWSISH